MSFCENKNTHKTKWKKQQHEVAPCRSKNLIYVYSYVFFVKIIFICIYIYIEIFFVNIGRSGMLQVQNNVTVEQYGSHQVQKVQDEEQTKNKTKTIIIKRLLSRSVQKPVGAILEQKEKKRESVLQNKERHSCL